MKKKFNHGKVLRFVKKMSMFSQSNEMNYMAGMILVTGSLAYIFYAELCLI